MLLLHTYLITRDLKTQFALMKAKNLWKAINKVIWQGSNFVLSCNKINTVCLYTVEIRLDTINILIFDTIFEHHHVGGYLCLQDSAIVPLLKAHCVIVTEIY